MHIKGKRSDADAIFIPNTVKQVLNASPTEHVETDTTISRPVQFDRHPVRCRRITFCPRPLVQILSNPGEMA